MIKGTRRIMVSSLTSALPPWPAHQYALLSSTEPRNFHFYERLSCYGILRARGAYTDSRADLGH